MTSLKAIAAAALLSTLTATPLFAQAAISEPGAFSFYHPDRDVLNGGAPIYQTQKPAVMPYAASRSYAAMHRGGAVHRAPHPRSRHAAH